MGIVQMEGGVSPIFQNLYTRLSTFEGAKDVYAEVISRYGESEINESNARAMAYLLAGYLAFCKHQLDVDLEARIERLEAEATKNRRGIA